MAMEYTVRVSDEVLESMALAAIEAYCLGDGRDDPGSKIETLGYVWGYRRIIDDLTIIFVSKISISISATRDNDSVTPHPEAAALKDEFVTRWSPQLTLLGDFHTHPYDDLDTVKRINGFEFSPADFRCFENDDFIWEKSGNAPVMLVMTICRLKRVRESWGEQKEIIYVVSLLENSDSGLMSQLVISNMRKGDTQEISILTYSSI